MKRLIQIGLAIALLTGCTTKFIYQSPEVKPPESTGIVFAYTKVEDQRENRKIDTEYENKNPLQDITKIIEEEVKSTGIFERVLLVQEDELNKDANLKVGFLMKSSLKEFKWTVPNYEVKVAVAFVAGIAGGLIGGIIYGAIPTDVYGDTVLKVQLTNISSGKLLIDKEYVGHCIDKKAILICDTCETKATIAGNSLKMVMEEFKKDLVKAVESRNGEMTIGR